MIVKIYSIFDSKAGAFLQPWFAVNNALAFRNCEKAMRNPQSGFADFPADFTLFAIADYDDITGNIKPYEAKENLGNMLQFLSSQDAPASTVAA